MRHCHQFSDVYRALGPGLLLHRHRMYSISQRGPDKMEKTTAVALARYLALSALILSACHQANAQSVVGAQISGVVTDPSGAVIPTAQIRATQTESGQTRTTASTSNGDYVLPNLPVGPYRLEVTNQGFERYVQSGII